MRDEGGGDGVHKVVTGGGKFSKLKKRNINPKKKKLREIASESRRQEIIKIKRELLRR